MEKIYCLTNFVLGACLASHAAVVVERMGKEDFIFARSRCAACHNELSLLDELPIISYFWLKGHCRYCHSPIPANLLVTEVIGGAAYFGVDFSRIQGLALALLLFSLLLTALSDCEQQEFDLALLLPTIILALGQINKVLHFQIFDFIELVPILLLLIYYVCCGKLGSGDLIIYLILVVYFNPHFANLVFLLACLFFIVHFLLERANTSAQVAFVPYLFLGLTVLLL